jgi:hypothetical protein
MKSNSKGAGPSTSAALLKPNEKNKGMSKHMRGKSIAALGKGKLRIHYIFQTLLKLSRRDK